MDRVKFIKSKYNVLNYARDVLGFDVKNSGDRCVSFAPNSKNPTALIIFDDWWYDFKQGIGGDVIDLCAYAKYDGDKGAAIRELSGDYSGENWVNYTQNLCNKIEYWHKQLRPEDIKYLHSRRINDETIERLKLGYDAKEQRLIIPYFKNGYVAYYVGRDRSGLDGVSKYKKAYLDGYNENIAWGLHTLDRKNTPDILVISEGAFDIMSFEQEGYKVLSPISGYFNKYALQQVINVAQNSDCTFICFDSDSAGTKFQIKMSQELFKHRVNFICGTLPVGFKDVSEYYTAGGDLGALISSAKNGVEILASRITSEDEFEKFVYDAARFVKEPELARLIINATQFNPAWLREVKKKALKAPAEKYIVDELLKEHNLKYMENIGFYEYSSGVWNKETDTAIRGYISDLYGHWATGNKTSSTFKLLQTCTPLIEVLNRKPLMNFTNGVLNIETGEFFEHNPAYLSSIQVEYAYNPNAQCPLWLKFIDDVMAHSIGMQSLLQEISGYPMFADNRLEKCSILTGNGSNGKSVFLKMLANLYSPENVSNVSISQFSEPFQRILLIDSMLNICTEETANLRDSESYFKQIVSGELINGCYKNKDFVKFEPRCKIFIACNNHILPKDQSYGFLRRLMFINFPRNFKGKEADKGLVDKLKSELPGIFNWAYEGYKRLRANMEFTETPEQERLMEEFRMITNPVAAFIVDELSEFQGQISRADIYKYYLSWCKETMNFPMSRNSFMNAFREELKQQRPAVQEKIIKGIRLFEF